MIMMMEKRPYFDGRILTLMNSCIDGDDKWHWVIDRFDKKKKIEKNKLYDGKNFFFFLISDWSKKEK